MPTPYNEWAINRVAIIYPAGPEKATLLALAARSQDNGEGCFASVEFLAAWLGKSRRTIQRHLRKLESCGALDIDYQAHGDWGSNEYSILCCKQKKLHRKEKAYRDGKQLALAIPTKQALSETYVEGGDIMTPSERHSVAQGATQLRPGDDILTHKPEPEPEAKTNIKDLGGDLILKIKGGEQMLEQHRTYVPDPPAKPLSAETRALIDETLNKLAWGPMTMTEKQIREECDRQFGALERKEVAVEFAEVD